MSILVLNAGSSSVKFALFDAGLTRLVSGAATEIGGTGDISIADEKHPARFASHAEALQAIMDGLAQRGIGPGMLSCAAHRVVHGGPDLVTACRIDTATMNAIEACVPLAPLHNPHNLALMRAMAAAAPDLPQYASFDTAFHATNPDVAVRYAIPSAEERKGIRRYGFHGISYSGLVGTLPEITGAPLPPRLLALHLGNGASLCAIRDGRSVATTMGYSPLEGLTMGTRSGSIDGNAVLRLAEEHGIARASAMLNRESGLVALGGMSDMRALHVAGTADAAFAIEHFCYWAVRHAGSMIAAMGGLDCIAFTGGIGENDADVRARIMDGLAWTGLAPDTDANRGNAKRLHAADSAICAWIVPADEERTIAADAGRLMAG